MIEETLSAENQFTSPHRVISPTSAGLMFNLAIRGTFVGTLTLRWSFDAGVTFYETGDTYDAPAGQVSVPLAEYGIEFTIGFKTGDYTSGTAIVRMGTGVAVV